MVADHGPKHTAGGGVTSAGVAWAMQSIHPPQPHWTCIPWTSAGQRNRVSKLPMLSEPGRSRQVLLRHGRRLRGKEATAGTCPARLGKHRFTES